MLQQCSKIISHILSAQIDSNYSAQEARTVSAVFLDDKVPVEAKAIEIPLVRVYSKIFETIAFRTCSSPIWQDMLSSLLKISMDRGN